MLTIPNEIHELIVKLLSARDCLECSLLNKSLSRIYRVGAFRTAYLNDRETAKQFFRCLGIPSGFSAYTQELHFLDGVFTMSQVSALKACRKLKSIHFGFEDFRYHQSRVKKDLVHDFEKSRQRTFCTPEPVLRTLPYVEDLALERRRHGTRGSFSIKYYLRGAQRIKSLSLINMPDVLKYSELDSIHAMCPNLETLSIRRLQKPDRWCFPSKRGEREPSAAPVPLKHVDVAFWTELCVPYLLKYFAHMYPQLETLKLVGCLKQLSRRGEHMADVSKTFAASCVGLRILHLEDFSLAEKDIHDLLQGKGLQQVTLLYKHMNIIDSSCYRVILKSIRPTVSTLRLSITRDAVEKGAVYDGLPNESIRELELRMVVDLYLCDLYLPGLLAQFPHLERLTLVGFTVLVRQANDLHYHKLSSLRLTHCRITAEFVQLLNHAHLPSLTKLELRNTQGGMCSAWSSQVSILDLDFGECKMTTLAIRNHQGCPVDFWTADDAYSTRDVLVVQEQQASTVPAEHFYHVRRKETTEPLKHYTDDAYEPLSPANDHRSPEAGLVHKLTKDELGQLRTVANQGFNLEPCGANENLVKSAMDLRTTGLVVVRSKTLHSFEFDGICLIERSKLVENPGAIATDKTETMPNLDAAGTALCRQPLEPEHDRQSQADGSTTGVLPSSTLTRQLRRSRSNASVPPTKRIRL